jgi:hypothetical protein
MIRRLKDCRLQIADLRFRDQVSGVRGQGKEINNKILSTYQPNHLPTYNQINQDSFIVDGFSLFVLRITDHGLRINHLTNHRGGYYEKYLC